MSKSSEEWHSDDFGKDYGDLFYKRAIGEAPEMESSKAAAKRLKSILKPEDYILDVGCGAGHYLRSLKNNLNIPFRYTGADVTPYYIEMAGKAFNKEKDVSFVHTNIFDLKFSDNTFDVVMSNNVLLHLPSVVKPLQELCRVAKRHVMVRTLIGPKSYVVLDVAPSKAGNDFDENNDPVGFHYLNIYSKQYIRNILSSIEGVGDVSIELDTDFDAKSLHDTQDLLPNAWDATRVEGNMQISGMIIQPWAWLDISLTK
jgi:ubiquinone/menaquinone biosynthesis C-methylase UbiE